MEERILIAGAGGQGALTIGKFLATVAMNGHAVTFLPSYGAEVRGGTAHCHVVISDQEMIANPVVDEATVLVVMNQMSYRRFVARLRSDGLLVVNSSMVQADPRPPCQRVVAVPASQLASEMGDLRVANVILLGALNTARPLLDEPAVFSAMEEILGKDPSKSKLLELNKRAYKVGVEQARKVIAGGPAGAAAANRKVGPPQGRPEEMNPPPRDTPFLCRSAINGIQYKEREEIQKPRQDDAEGEGAKGLSQGGAP